MDGFDRSVIAFLISIVLFFLSMWGSFKWDNWWIVVCGGLVFVVCTGVMVFKALILPRQK